MVAVIQRLAHVMIKLTLAKCSCCTRLFAIYPIYFLLNSNPRRKGSYHRVHSEAVSGGGFSEQHVGSGVETQSSIREQLLSRHLDIHTSPQKNNDS